MTIKKQTVILFFLFFIANCQASQAINSPNEIDATSDQDAQEDHHLMAHQSPQAPHHDVLATKDKGYLLKEEDKSANDTFPLLHDDPQEAPLIVQKLNFAPSNEKKNSDSKGGRDEDGDHSDEDLMATFISGHEKNVNEERKEKVDFLENFPVQTYYSHLKDKEDDLLISQNEYDKTLFEKNKITEHLTEREVQKDGDSHKEETSLMPSEPLGQVNQPSKYQHRVEENKSSFLSFIDLGSQSTLSQRDEVRELRSNSYDASMNYNDLPASGQTKISPHKVPVFSLQNQCEDDAFLTSKLQLGNKRDNPEPMIIGQIVLPMGEENQFLEVQENRHGAEMMRGLYASSTANNQLTSSNFRGALGLFNSPESKIFTQDHPGLAFNNRPVNGDDFSYPSELQMPIVKKYEDENVYAIMAQENVYDSMEQTFNPRIQKGFNIQSIIQVHDESDQNRDVMAQLPGLNLRSPKKQMALHHNPKPILSPKPFYQGQGLRENPSIKQNLELLTNPMADCNQNKNDGLHKALFVQEEAHEEVAVILGDAFNHEEEVGPQDVYDHNQEVLALLEGDFTRDANDTLIKDECDNQIQAKIHLSSQDLAHQDQSLPPAENAKTILAQGVDKDNFIKKEKQSKRKAPFKIRLHGYGHFQERPEHNAVQINQKTLSIQPCLILDPVYTSTMRPVVIAANSPDLSIPKITPQYVQKTLEKPEKERAKWIGAFISSLSIILKNMHKVSAPNPAVKVQKINPLKPYTPVQERLENHAFQGNPKPVNLALPLRLRRCHTLTMRPVVIAANSSDLSIPKIAPKYVKKTLEKPEKERAKWIGAFISSLSIILKNMHKVSAPNPAVKVQKINPLKPLSHTHAVDCWKKSLVESVIEKKSRTKD